MRTFRVPKKDSKMLQFYRRRQGFAPLEVITLCELPPLLLGLSAEFVEVAECLNLLLHLDHLLLQGGHLGLDLVLQGLDFL